jgi:HK97 gp10 family phage protein
MSKVVLTGFAELDALFKALPAAVSHKIVGSAAFAAAKPLVAKERELAPKGKTLNLSKSIGATKVSRTKATSVGEVHVGPRRKGGFKGFGAQWSEFGTKPRRNKKGANRGRMAAKPFIEPAFEATKQQVDSSLVTEIARSVTKTMKRYAKK